VQGKHLSRSPRPTQVTAGQQDPVIGDLP